MRLCEFETSSHKEDDGLHLYAWAKYKRGDVPTAGEYAYINNRVLAKYPTAELVRMDRRPIPSFNNFNDWCTKSTEAWWKFEWIVFNETISGNDAGKNKPQTKEK